MARKMMMLAGAVLGTFLLAGGGIPPAHGKAETVTIDNFSFTPARIVVAPGTTVTWENRDDIPHTVTDAGDPRAFKSAALDTGETFSHRFAAPGTYDYFCSLHPHMQATVVVR